MSKIADLIDQKEHTWYAWYTAKGEVGLGAELLEKGLLEAVVFVYAMFTLLTTANPKLEEIREAEVQHILDTIFEFTFSKYGKVNIDIIYRKHVGASWG